MATGQTPGYFWSPWLMLVSNAADKEDASVAQYTKRLFKAKLGDKVWAYVAGETKSENLNDTANVPVAHTVKVHPTILMTGVAQSTWPVNVPSGTKTDTLDQLKQVAKDLAKKNIVKANEAFAQVGIQLIVPEDVMIDVKYPPGRINLDNDAPFRISAGQLPSTPDEDDFFASDYRTTATDDVELFYVNSIKWRQQNDYTGWAYWASAPTKDTAVISTFGLRKDPYLIAEKWCQFIF